MYLLLGYGKSNQSIEKYFIKKNIKYIVYDDYNKKNNIDLKNIDVVIKSNGIRNDHFIFHSNELMFPCSRSPGGWGEKHWARSQMQTVVFLPKKVMQGATQISQ